MNQNQNDNQIVLLCQIILFCFLLLTTFQIEAIVAEKEQELENQRIEQLIRDHALPTMSEEVKEKIQNKLDREELELSRENSKIQEYCANPMEFDSFKEYLIEQNLPTAVYVDGMRMEPNEFYASVDCLLVYGDQFDVPTDEQRVVQSRMLYIGYDINGNLFENPLLQN